MELLRKEIDREGFAVLAGVFSGGVRDTILADVEACLAGHALNDGSIRAARDQVYASRNLLSVWPAALELAQAPPLRAALTAILGPACGLVRALYFDKPPGRSWSLPWHKDLTVAVRDNSLAGEHFSKPTNKAGVPHVEAPESVLAQMLTTRIHLDEVTPENGPLRVVRGSHRTGKTSGGVLADTEHTATILTAAGDVLLMRPMIEHCSGNSLAGTQRHRRIVHLEFAAATSLLDGYEWHDFWPLGDVAR